MQSYLNGRGHQDGAGRLQGDRAWGEALAVHAVGEQHRVPPELAAQDVLHCRRDGCQGRGQVHDPVEELVLPLVVVLHLQATGTVSVPQRPEPNQMWYMQRMGRMRAMSAAIKLTPDIVCSPGVCFTACSCRENSDGGSYRSAAVHMPSTSTTQLSTSCLLAQDNCI